MGTIRFVRLSRCIASVLLGVGLVCLEACEYIPTKTQNDHTAGQHLSASEASALAARIANDECDRLYGERPFNAEYFPVRLLNGRYESGRLDLAGVSGYSAEVAFGLDGTDREVQVYYSSDKF